MYVDMFQKLFTIRSRGGRRSNTTDRIGHSGRAKQDRRQRAIVTILKVQASTTSNEVRTNQEIATNNVKIRYHKCMNTDGTHRDCTIQPPTMKSSNAKNSQRLAVQGNDVSAKIRLNSRSNASEPWPAMRVISLGIRTVPVLSMLRNSLHRGRLRQHRPRSAG